LHGYTVNAQDIPVNASYISQVRATGAIVANTSRWYNGVVVRITNPSQITAINALPFVQSTKSVARIKPLPKYVGPRETTTPAQKLASSQSVNRFNYGQGANQIHLLNGECLHNAFYDGTGMQIAEIDDGFNNANTISVFDSLWMQHRVLAKHNFFNGDTTDLFSIGGHGTSVLSCMAAFSNNNFVGTAPYAKYYLLRSEVDSSEQIMEEYSWVSALEFADSAGADVATSSLGYTTFDDATQSHTWADLTGRVSVASNAATLAACRGMIVCVAAGNEGVQSWRKITVPSDADSILCVGAVDEFGSYAPFSSQGYSADGRVKPDVMSQGANSTVVSSNTGNVVTSSGTSFATPILAGLVACLWQGNPTKTNMEVMQAIKKSSTQFASPDSLMGYGIPDFCVADQILKGNNGIASYQQALYFDGSGFYLPGKVDGKIVTEIYDSQGRLLLEENCNVTHSANRSTIDIPSYRSLPLGIYIIRLTNGANSWTRKMAKN
jgi:subtilisin family serine protease